MIKPGEREARSMLTLPKNEAGFTGLRNAIKEHKERCVQDFSVAAQRAVFDPTARDSALALSGQVKAITDVLTLLDNLVLGE